MFLITYFGWFLGVVIGFSFVIYYFVVGVGNLFVLVVLCVLLDDLFSWYFGVYFGCLFNVFDWSLLNVLFRLCYGLEWMWVYLLLFD